MSSAIIFFTFFGVPLKVRFLTLSFMYFMIFVVKFFSMSYMGTKQAVLVVDDLLFYSLLLTPSENVNFWNHSETLLKGKEKKCCKIDS